MAAVMTATQWSSALFSLLSVSSCFSPVLVMPPSHFLCLHVLTASCGACMRLSTTPPRYGEREGE